MNCRATGEVTRLKFVETTGPLPVISVRVNGGDEVTFFIDTGGSEVTLDTDFAKELGLPQFGTVQGTFSGGQQADGRAVAHCITHARRLDRQEPAGRNACRYANSRKASA